MLLSEDLINKIKTKEGLDKVIKYMLQNYLQKIMN